MSDGEEWRQRAACRDRSVLFFATGRRRQAEALAICGGCTVRAECGRWAAGQAELEGVVAGVVRGKRPRPPRIPAEDLADLHAEAAARGYTLTPARLDWIARRFYA